MANESSVNIAIDEPLEITAPLYSFEKHCPLGPPLAPPLLTIETTDFDFQGILRGNFQPLARFPFIDFLSIEMEAKPGFIASRC